MGAILAPLMKVIQILNISYIKNITVLWGIQYAGKITARSGINENEMNNVNQ